MLTPYIMPNANLSAKINPSLKLLDIQGRVGIPSPENDFEPGYARAVSYTVP
jgi:hypothetical protein